MQLDWSKEYLKLTDFVAENPEITIRENVVRIPSVHSPEFYSLHKKVRTVFLEEKAPHLFKKAQELSSNYIKIEEEVKTLVGIEDIKVQASLDNFLHNPADQLIKEIYTSLFGLLKGQLDAGKFEEVAVANIETFFKKYYRSGYEKWVTLSLVKLLNADKVFKVIPEEVTEDDSFKHGGIIDYKIPDPEEMSDISFIRDIEVGFMVPDLLIHSVVGDKYYSFTSEIIKTYAGATNPSKKREWLPADPTVVFESGIILLYTDKELTNLALVSDMKRTCKADLIVECRVLKNWHEKEGLSKVRQHNEKYKPRLGTYIVTIEPVTEQIQAELASQKVLLEPATMQSPGTAGNKEVENNGSQVHLLTVGFNDKNLASIINALI
jgi:hypothetical protein